MRGMYVFSRDDYNPLKIQKNIVSGSSILSEATVGVASSCVHCASLVSAEWTPPRLPLANRTGRLASPPEAIRIRGLILVGAPSGANIVSVVSQWHLYNVIPHLPVLTKVGNAESSLDFTGFPLSRE
jgi:hypothetical protein